MDSEDRKPRRYQISRRQLMQLAGLGLTGAALESLLAACGGSSTTATSAAATAAKAATTASGGAATTATSSTTGGTTASPTSKTASPVTTSGSPVAATSNYQVPTIASGSHSLKMLMWSHFVPAYDDWFDKWAKDWGSKNKVDVTVDHIPTNTIPTRFSAEVSANSGHDLVQFQNGSDVHVFGDKLVDLTDLAGYFAAQYGGWADVAKDALVVGGKWKGVGQYLIRFPSMYRKDLFDAAGLKPVDMWEDLVGVGQKLKPQGHPVGFAISQTGDSNSTLYSVLWSYGGAVTDKDGKTVTIKSDGTKAAIQAVQNIYQQAMTQEVLSWDDSSNNRYIASGVGSYILNPISAYRSSPQDIQDKLAISLAPKGPKAQLVNCPVYAWGLSSWSKEQAAAEKFLVDFYAAWKDGFTASTGYNHPLLLSMTQKPMPVLAADPKLSVLQDFLPLARTVGYPGPATAAAGQVNNTYVIPNMFAKAVTGQSADDAMAWAEEQIKAIYDKYPTG